MKIKNFRQEIKSTFRKHFIQFFNDIQKCEFKFYKCILPRNKFRPLVNNNFRTLNGKCYLTTDNNLILAIHQNDYDTPKLLNNFKEISLE
jgi:hypothetical protein